MPLSKGYNELDDNGNEENHRCFDARGSGAMRADSRQTDFCTYLSGILLGGLLLNAVAGWWRADPVAAGHSADHCERRHRRTPG
jgi:2-keto-3-deoxy-galactonokinase